jgi:hypothetical protein
MDGGEGTQPDLFFQQKFSNAAPSARKNGTLERVIKTVIKNGVQPGCAKPRMSPFFGMRMMACLGGKIPFPRGMGAEVKTAVS